MISRRFLLSTVLALALVPKAKADPMLPYSRLVVFGDGLSDQGRWGPLTGYRYPPSPPFAAGRWTGGPTWVEHLATLSGVPLEARDNHAMGGAITGWWNINEPLRAALGLGADVPLPGLRGQVEAALAAGPADPEALYILWAGGHDIGNWLEYGQPDIAAEPPAANLRAAAERLIGAGARHILVGTMPDMGATALYAGTDKAARATAATEDLNAGIRAWAAALSQGGVQVIVLDGAAAFAQAFARAGELGITVFDEAFLPYDIIDFANPLAPARPVPEGRDPNAYFSFWAVSAGPRVHRAIADYALGVLQAAN
ncbi:MAG: SGNH/GDSL hydrolase family protein [Tabrizicola sp.]